MRAIFTITALVLLSAPAQAQCLTNYYQPECVALRQQEEQTRILRDMQQRQQQQEWTRQQERNPAPGFKGANLDSSWIGRLGEKIRQRRMESQRGELLANVDVANPDSVRAAARKLMATGRQEDIELAFKLMQMAKPAPSRR